MFLERVINDVFEAGRQVRIKAHGRQRRFVKNGIEHGRGGLSAKGKLSGGHLVEHDAEGEKIGAGIQILAESLFRRHVGNAAKRGGRAGEGFVMGSVGSEISLASGASSHVK